VGLKTDETEGKLKKLIGDTVAELLDGREKKSRSAKETPEQRWIRDVIGEELDRRFEEFTAALLGGDDDKKKPDDEEEGEGFSLRSILGGKA
jgi:uncharacterized protein with von Willebrand factor type A (vWA) domain